MRAGIHFQHAVLRTEDCADVKTSAATLNFKPNPGSQHLTVLRTFSGDHTGKETPVPIPNTAVKLSGPMIVPTSAKVGIARFYNQKPRWDFPAGFFICGRTK